MTTRILTHVTILLAVMLVVTACHDVGINVNIPPQIKAGLDRETLARIDNINDTLAEGVGLDPETRALIEELNTTLAKGLGPNEATLQRIDRLLADIEAGLDIGLDYETRQTVEKLIATLGTAPQAWGATLNEIIRTLEASSVRIADKMADEVRDLLDQATLDLKEIGASTGEQFFCTYKVLSTDIKNNVNAYIAMSLADRLKVILFGAEMPPVTMAPEVCQIIPSQVDLEKRGDTLVPKNNAVIITGYGFAETNRPEVYLLAEENGKQLAVLVPLVNTSYRMTLNLQAVESFDKVQKGAQIVFVWPGGAQYSMAVFLPEEIAVPTLTINADIVRIYKGPSTFYWDIQLTSKGVVHEVVGGYDGWWKIKYETDTNSGVFDEGWIPANVAVRNEVPAPVITAPLPPPSAEIHCDVPSAYVPVDVVCTADLKEGQPALARWAWTCGDQSGTQSNNPITCKYTTAGSYTVELKVTNDMGWGVATPVNITVQNKPPGPKAVFTTSQPPAGEAPFTLTFTNLSEGSVPNWTWEFDDNTPSFSNDDPVLSPEQKRTFSHTFDNPGKYDVTLTVSDDIGQSDKMTLTIVVSPQSKIYQGAMFITRYVGLRSTRSGTDQKVHFATGYQNQDFQCGIIGIRAQGGMADPSCEDWSGGGCISTVSRFTEAYMEVDTGGQWWVNASITTFPGYGVMEPSKWDVDMLCVQNDVFSRGGARYIAYSTVSSGSDVRSDLRLDSTTNEYRAETGVSAADYTCELVGYAFNEGWYGPNPAYDFTARVEAIDGRWIVRTLFQDVTTGPAVWTRANVLCLSNEAQDIVYLTIELPNPNTGQYTRRLDLPAGSYNCGVIGVDVSDGQMNTSSGYQELLLAQARQLPDGGWEVQAGMPRVAGEGETWTIDVVCLASRYVLRDLTTAP